MSTRCSIVIKTAKGNIYLYRHMDGYPECTGNQVKAVCQYARKHVLTFEWVKDYLLSLKRQPDFKGVVRNLYEKTDSIHGDIDWLYTISEKLNVRTKHISFDFEQEVTMVDFVWNEKVLEAKKEIKDLNERYEDGLFNTKDYFGRMTELINKWYNVIPDEDVTEVEDGK